MGRKTQPLLDKTTTKHLKINDPVWYPILMDKQIIQPLPKETPLAYQYFILYCEMQPAERSLRALCQREVNGKKRSVKVIGRWSSQHHWQSRTSSFDAYTQRQAAEALLQRRQTEIEDFIEKDLRVSRQFQEICLDKLKQISESGNADTTELRQWAMAYTQNREWVKELIGIVQLQQEMDNTAEKETEYDRLTTTETIG